MSRLVLGTAQFGARYGVTNDTGRLKDHEVAAVARAAINGGISTFDTSPYYGDAQDRLGRLFTGDSRPDYISKFGIESDDPSPDEIFGGTLAELGVDRLAGLLFHRVADLRDPRSRRVWDTLRSARDSRRVGLIGASIYDADDLAVALNDFPDLDILQLPGSVADRRLLDHPDVRSFHGKGGKIHVRSAYLQGLLVTAPHSVPDHLAVLRPTIQALNGLAETMSTTPVGLALGFLKHHVVVDAVVVGALSRKEIQATLGAWEEAVTVEFPDPRLPPEALDPREWPKLDAS